MTLSLLLTIVGIGIVDSLNPSLFVAQFFLLGTARPIPRLLSYIAGILVVNYVGGVLLLAGARAVISEFLANLDPRLVHAGALVLGAASLLFALHLWRGLRKNAAAPATPNAPTRKPRSLHPIHTFFFGMVVMVNELSTALPYFVALEQIAQAQLPITTNLLLLVVYNFFFSLPLLAFVGLFVIFRARFITQIDAINAFINRWTPYVMIAVTLLLGLWLLWAGISFFLGTSLTAI
jgi:cytochrome c biogenesis protein CcdA